MNSLLSNKKYTCSTTDYYPFGQPLPDRSFSGEEYRFGFNGQEKDKDVTGKDATHTTAMFWEYDSRLGRRWNMDPIKKSWQSQYCTFSDSPIWRIDPDGDDDFFDQFGNYIGSSSSGSKIMVVNAAKVNIASFKQKDGNINNSLSERAQTLSSFLYDRKIDVKQKKQFSTSVGTHYGKLVGVKGDVIPAKYTDKTAYAFCVKTASAGNVHTNVDYQNFADFDDYNDVKSILHHEKIHQELGLTNMPVYDEELYTLKKQVSSSLFNNTTENFKLGVIGYIQKNLQDKLNVESGAVGTYEKTQSEVDELNKLSNKTGVVFKIIESGTVSEREYTVKSFSTKKK